MHGVIPLISLITLSVFLQLTSCQLVQVQIIHRHGARQPLQKHETDPGIKEHSGKLYPEGVEQLKKLGSFIREEYQDSLKLKDTECSKKVVSFSSNFQRTQGSARAFLKGLCGDSSHTVATKVFYGEDRDWIIRGYALCPRLGEKMAEFVNSDAVKEQKEEHEKFVADLAKKVSQLEDKAQFTNVFNVFDVYNIAQNNYDDEYSTVEKLDENNMKRLKGVADWYESNKFHFDTHKLNVARGLLKEMTQQADWIVSGDKRGHKIVEYSGHYPTLLSLFSSLRKSKKKIEFPADKIPGFGAALIIEVHKTEDGYSMRLRWKDGEEVKDVAGGFKGCEEEDKLCASDKWKAVVKEDGEGSEEEFYKDCGEECKSCGSAKRSGGVSKVVAGLIGAVVGLLVGLVLSFGRGGWRKNNRQQERWYEREEGEDGEVSVGA